MTSCPTWHRSRRCQVHRHFTLNSTPWQPLLPPFSSDRLCRRSRPRPCLPCLPSCSRPGWLPRRTCIGSRPMPCLGQHLHRHHLHRLISGLTTIQCGYSGTQLLQITRIQRKFYLLGFQTPISSRLLVSLMFLISLIYKFWLGQVDGWSCQLSRVSWLN